MADDPRCILVEFKGYNIEVYPVFGPADQVIGYGAAWLSIDDERAECALTVVRPTVGTALDAAMESVCLACAAEVERTMEWLGVDDA